MTQISGFGPVGDDDLFPVWIQGNRIHIRTPFTLKDTVKALPGGRWAPNEKAWHYPATPGAARAIIEALGEHRLDLDWQVAALAAEARKEDDALKFKDAEVLPEIPGRLPAWLHQKRAYHWALQRRGSMLGMDMGTGKSRTAISLLDGWDSTCAVLICPRSVMNVWPNQFAQHSERPWRVIVPPTNATVQKRTAYIWREFLHARKTKQRVAIVVNYEASWREPLKSTILKMMLVDAKGEVDLILDESHRIKAPGGTASKTCGLFGQHARHVLALTGTPMPHSPLDVYGQYRALDPGIFGTNFSRFRMRYALMGGFEGKQVVGYQNQDELARKFGGACFVVKKTEAGLDLPPVVHVDRKFELSARARKAYSTLEHDFILGVEGGTVTTANALVKLLRLQQVTSGYVRDDDGEDRHIADDKIAELQDVLEDIPEPVYGKGGELEKPGEPVAIFARFKHDVRKIAELCRGQGRRVGIVDGDHKPGHPLYGLNEHSQMRDDVDVIILQLQSGGVGIDLTRACLCIYYSLDFSLGNYDQTLARLDRPGQKRSVTYIHLIASNTKDEVVYQALQERRDVVEATIAASRRATEPPAQAA